MTKSVRKSLFIPPTNDPQQRRFFESLKEIVEVGEGARGNPLDKKLTFRDLISSGLATRKNGGGGGLTGSDLLPSIPDIPPLPAPDIPPAPTGAHSMAGIGTAYIQWDIPQFEGYSHANVYRSPDNNFANAEVLSQSQGSLFVDPLPYDLDEDGNPIGYYYWVTFVTSNGVEEVEGPPHAVNGVFATPAADPEHMLHLFTGKITSGQLHNTLLAPIQSISGIVDVQEQLVADVAQALASWTVKIDNNGRVSGVGLMDDGETSTFEILANNFAVIDPNDPSKVILGTNNGSAVIDGAYIKAATIKSAAIESLVVNKITGDQAAFNSFYANTLQVTNAMISGQLSASKIDTRGLVIKDWAGNIIFGSGYDLDWGRVSGAGKPEDGATVGATIGQDLGGQITAATASTFIANGAMGTLQVAGGSITSMQYADFGAKTISAANNTQSSAVTLATTYVTMPVGHSGIVCQATFSASLASAGAALTMVYFFEVGGYVTRGFSNTITGNAVSNPCASHENPQGGVTVAVKLKAYILGATSVQVNGGSITINGGKR